MAERIHDHGRKQVARKRKSTQTLPRKTCWHLYSLQNLNSEKFVKVVNKVLQREWQLIK